MGREDRRTGKWALFRLALVNMGSTRGRWQALLLSTLSATVYCMGERTDSVDRLLGSGCSVQAPRLRRPLENVLLYFHTQGSLQDYWVSYHRVPHHYNLPPFSPRISEAPGSFLMIQRLDHDDYCGLVEDTRRGHEKDRVRVAGKPRRARFSYAFVLAS
jgi:hypothetical protein